MVKGVSVCEVQYASDHRLLHKCHLELGLSVQGEQNRWSKPSKHAHTFNINISLFFSFFSGGICRAPEKNYIIGRHQ